MKKKIALCYSGLIRDLAVCFPTHIEHIIKANPDYEFYIFAHFWNDNLYFDFQKIGFYPHSMILDRIHLFKSELITDSRFPVNMHVVKTMFFSIKKTFIIKTMYEEEYDIVFDSIVRIRPDLFFYNNLRLNEYPDDKIILNKQFIHMDYGVNDLFAIGPPHYMKYHFYVGDYVEDLIHKGCAINSECLVGFNLIDKKCPVYQTPLQHHIFEIYKDLRR